MARYSASMMTAGVCLCLTALPLGAFEIFGFKFFEEEETETVELISPLYYNLEMVVTGDDVDLRANLERASALFRDRDRPASGRAGLLSAADGDYGRLVETLYARGYYSGSLSITIGGREAADIPLDVDLETPTEVRISVDPGELYRFRTAEIIGVLPGTALDGLGFEPGAPARSDAVRDASRAAVLAWARKGHATADIPQAEVIADHQTRELDAALTVVPGPLVRFGDVTIKGTNRVRGPYLQYMADLPKGETYDPDRIADARKRLLKLDAFGVVDIEEQPLAPDGSMPIEITVQDRKPRRIGFGATVSSIDGIGVEGFWLHRNILSRGERLRFDGAVRGIGRSFDPSAYDYELGATFIKPGTLTPDTDFELGVTLERERLENYDALTFGLKTGFSSLISDDLTGQALLAVERSRIDDSLGRRNFLLYGIEGGLTYEARDVPLDATTGYWIDLTAFPFYESNSGQFGLRSTAEARAYTPLGGTGRFVLAGRAKIGSVTGIGLTEAPPQVLFFSGGGGSVRGFEYLSEGVILPGGQEIGGRSLIEASAEIRAKLNENFGMVGFMDAGIVGPTASPDFTEEINVGVGVGLRWRTGFGPLRVDFARAINHKAGDPVVGVYIGLGQAF